MLASARHKGRRRLTPPGRTARPRRPPRGERISGSRAQCVWLLRRRRRSNGGRRLMCRPVASGAGASQGSAAPMGWYSPTAHEEPLRRPPQRSCRRPRVTLGHARGPSRLASAALLRELHARSRRADRGAVAPPAVLYVRRLSSRACDGSNHRHSACTRVDSALFTHARAVQSHRSSAAPPVLAARHRRATKGVAPCGRVVVVGDAQRAVERTVPAEDEMRSRRRRRTTRCTRVAMSCAR